uniref:Retrovirus-related Pol polyprotein from transposon TNT 1-94-like beta-barrel domain-containing protein n=1 Tax=Vitis vinifera TaxID=29760 RepID=A5AWL4_VITVI|nr:hypothetical protein VITISV_037898 [Vitis vinifera]
MNGEFANEERNHELKHGLDEQDVMHNQLSQLWHKLERQQQEQQLTTREELLAKANRYANMEEELGVANNKRKIMQVEHTMDWGARKNHKKIGFWAKNGELIEALASQLNRPGYQSTNYLFLIEVPSRTAKSTLSLLVAFPSQLRYMPSRSTSGRGLVEDNETIVEMITSFTDIVNGLEALGKTYEESKKVMKILRSIPSKWHTKVTTIQEAKDLTKLPLEKLIGSLMTYEINLAKKQHEGEDKKRKSIALKTTTKEEEEVEEEKQSEEDEDLALIIRKFNKFMRGKKFKGRRFASRRDLSKKESSSHGDKERWEEKRDLVCFKYKKLVHIKYDCPLYKSEAKRRKKKTTMATWSESKESSEEEKEKEVANMCFMEIDELDDGSKKDKWFLDSGCSRHMIGDESKFAFLTKKNGGYVTFEDNATRRIIGQGNIEFFKCMHSEFEMSMVGELNFFIGLQINQLKERTFINQAKYIRDLLKRFNMEESKTMKTPMSSSIKLDKDEKGRHRDEVSYYEAFLIDSILTGRWIHLGYLMMMHMISCCESTTRILPYGRFLTRLFKDVGVDLSRETDFEAPSAYDTYDDPSMGRMKFEKAPNGSWVTRVERSPAQARRQGQTYLRVEEEVEI